LARPAATSPGSWYVDLQPRLNGLSWGRELIYVSKVPVLALAVPAYGLPAIQARAVSLYFPNTLLM
jgi:hypothetical protein